MTAQNTSDDEIKSAYNTNVARVITSQTSYSSKVADLKWFNIGVLVFLHGLFVREFFKYPWLKNVDLIIFNLIYGNLAAIAVSAGVHRLWTHRSYKAKLPLRIVWMVFYCFAAINPIMHWVRDHRVHHKFTDTDADPHNSKRGFFFSHMGWLMVKKHPELIQKGKSVDISDIMEDPVVRFDLKYHIPLIIVLGFIIPTSIPPLVWGKDWHWSFLTCLARYLITMHTIWTINSAAHKWGVKPYNKCISPTDRYYFSFFTVGEAWHNYHHAFPWAYKLGRLTGFQTDLGGFFIDMFAKIGWAYDLKTPSIQLLKHAAEKAGDGSFTLWGADMEIPENLDNELCNNNNEDIKKVE